MKAWDVYNNSGKGFTEFIVAESADIALNTVLNYPNPVLDETTFQFEYNQAGEALQVAVNIYTTAGSLVRSIQQEMQPSSPRAEIEWDGLDADGQTIGAGMYFYEIVITNRGNNTARKYNQLVILR